MNFVNRLRVLIIGLVFLAPALSAQYRNSDSYRIRDSSEMPVAYSMAGAYTSLSALTFASLYENEDKRRFASYLGIVGGAAISFPFLLLTDNVGEKFRYGNPSGLSYGFVSGIATGITSAFLIHSYRENRRGFPLFRLYSTSMWLAATAESLALGTLAYTTELRPGQSAIIASAGIWGSGLGMSSSSMRMKERDRFTEPVRAWSAMGGHVAALAGATTAVYAFDYSPSQLQVLLMNSGYSAGLLSAFYFTGNSAKAGPGYVAMASTIGSLIGLGAGATFAHLFFEQDRKDLRDPKRLEKASALDSLTLSVAPSMNAEKASDLSIMASVQF